jgi:hypothetical protein
MIILNKVVFIVSVLMCLSTSCDKPPGAEIVYSIYIENKSSTTIYFMLSELFPDTSILSIENNYLILTNGEEKTINSDEKWQEKIDNLPSDTLSVFFFSEDTILKYGFNNVRQNYRVLKRKDLSFSDIEKNNFRVTYP